MQEQLEEKRNAMGFEPPRIYEGERKKSQKQSAIDMLKSRRPGSPLVLTPGGRKRRSRRVPKRRVKRTRKTRKV